MELLLLNTVERLLAPPDLNWLELLLVTKVNKQEKKASSDLFELGGQEGFKVSVESVLEEPASEGSKALALWWMILIKSNFSTTRARFGASHQGETDGSKCRIRTLALAEQRIVRLL